MSIISSLLQKTSTVKRICILFVTSHLLLLSMMVFTFPAINEQIETNAFDLQTFGYSITTAETIVNNLNHQTTQLYIFPQLTFLDLLYPLLLAIFLSSLLFRLVNKNRKIESLLVFIPFLAMIFDYLENICIILMISKTIELSEIFVLISSSFTILKSITTSIAWLAILFYTIKWLFFKFKWKNNKQSLTKAKLKSKTD